MHSTGNCLPVQIFKLNIMKIGWMLGQCVNTLQRIMQKLTPYRA